MNLARILILALAGVAAVAAAIFVRGAMQASPEPAPVQQAEREQAPSVRVLAARSDFTAGQRIQPADLYWQAWPEEALSPAYITERARPDAMSEFAGAVVRAQMAQGEPVSGRKLVQPGDSGFMAAVIDPGMRAVAVPTSAEAGAGGFILPNDRVDVIATMDQRDSMNARILVENVRVLAIDQTYSEEENGAVVGSVADSGGTPVTSQIETAEPANGEAREVRVFRYGREERVALGGNR